MALNIEQLIELSDRLDRDGKHKEAAELDAMIKKMAAVMVEDNDPKFEEAYKAEHGNKPESVYVGKDEEQVTETDKLMPEKTGFRSSSVAADP